MHCRSVQFGLVKYQKRTYPVTFFLIVMFPSSVNLVQSFMRRRIVGRTFLIKEKKKLKLLYS